MHPEAIGGADTDAECAMVVRLHGADVIQLGFSGEESCCRECLGTGRIHGGRSTTRIRFDPSVNCNWIHRLSFEEYFSAYSSTNSFSV